MRNTFVRTFCWVMFVLCQFFVFTNGAEPIDIKIEQGEKRQKGPKFIMMIPDKKPILSAFDYSGGYFNPVLATSLKAGCEGHTLLEHAAVYWLGACAGSIISVYLYKLPTIQKYVRGTTEANGDSIWADKED